jgi:excisionase family DNA binding protein
MIMTDQSDRSYPKGRPIGGRGKVAEGLETVYLSPKEVAERLKLRVQTIYHYIRTGRLPAVRFGNRCRIAVSDLETFVAACRDPAPVRADRRPGEADPTGGASKNGEEQPGHPSSEARRLLKEWMADDSGYDEKVWPIVAQLLDAYPVSVGETQDD